MRTLTINMIHLEEAKIIKSFLRNTSDWYGEKGHLSSLRSQRGRDERKVRKHKKKKMREGQRKKKLQREREIKRTRMTAGRALYASGRAGSWSHNENAGRDQDQCERGLHPSKDSHWGKAGSTITENMWLFLTLDGVLFQYCFNYGCWPNAINTFFIKFMLHSTWMMALFLITEWSVMLDILTCPSLPSYFLIIHTYWCDKKSSFCINGSQRSWQHLS